MQATANAKKETRQSGGRLTEALVLSHVQLLRETRAAQAENKLLRDAMVSQRGGGNGGKKKPSKPNQAKPPSRRATAGKSKGRSREEL
jgi:hypothetical protein